MSKKLEFLSEIENRLASEKTDIRISLLYAQTYTLAPEELNAVLIDRLQHPGYLTNPLRKALEKIGQSERHLDALAKISDDLRGAWPTAGRARQRIDSFLSLIYPYLAVTDRETLLEFWKRRSTKGSYSRWLKAIRNDPLLFSPEEICDYWIRSGDLDAAKVVAYELPAEYAPSILDRMVECSLPGWLVGRCIIRAGLDPREVAGLQHHYPGTFLYTIHKTGRVATEQEALDSIAKCEVGFEGDIGLALWAVGNMGLFEVLKEFESSLLDKKEAEERSRYLDHIV